MTMLLMFVFASLHAVPYLFRHSKESLLVCPFAQTVQLTGRF
jgi:hypothetical protein